MDRLCKYCKYWVSAESILNWGNCRKNTNQSKKQPDKSVGGVLRRCDESCSDFKASRVAKKRSSTG